MKKLTNLVAGPAAAALLCIASVSPSHAAPTTAFVSGGGSDANACTLAAPCRSIGRALFFAASGGTVSCLDAGPYTEAFNIGSPFTLDCRGVVYTSASAAFMLTGAAAVTFRNLIFDGSAGGGGAVQVAGGNVVFENCTFQNFTGSPGVAVWFTPSVAGAHLTITDSVFTNNGGMMGGGGILIQPTSPGVTAGAVIERTQVTGNGSGIVAGGASGSALVEVRYSTISNNASEGILAITAGPVESIVVEHSASVQNGSGIVASGANAFVSLSDSTVDWNALGLATPAGGLILSYQDNLIAGNLSPGVTPLSVGKQ
jgi:Right handed beta helix region